MIMKRILFLLFFFTTGFSAFAQYIDTLYYNEYWQLVPKQEAKFYRVAEIEPKKLRFTGKFSDHYNSGQLIQEGQYSSSGKKNGPFKIFYKNGRLFCRGAFDNDYFTGTWEYFYPEGSLKERVRFNNGWFVVLDYVDQYGRKLVTNGNGTWRHNISDGEGEMLELTARFSNKKRYGTWTLRWPDGTRQVREVYEDGKLVSGTIYDYPLLTYNETRFKDDIFYPSMFYIVEGFNVWQATKKDYPYIGWLPDGPSEEDSLKQEIEVFEKPDRPATYPGGMATFYRHISQVLNYPSPAREQRIEGKVLVEIIIGVEGNIVDIQVLKGIGGGCDQEAVMAVLDCGKWIPAQKSGRPLEQKIVIPISFDLK